MAAPRVGIMSMQRIRNYGSTLQAYGLRRMLESLGCEVRFVGYRPGPCLVGSRGRGLPRPVAKLTEALGGSGPLRARFAYANHKRCYDARTWPLLGLSAEPDCSTDDLDMLVIGSDEVFNCAQSNPNVGFSPDLFGAGFRSGRTVTYAASCGNTTLGRLRELGVAERVTGWLGALDAVSVRDENTATVVRMEGYGNAEKLVDLLSRLGLRSRAASSPGDYDYLLDSVPDWAPVRRHIADGRQAAWAYLAEQVTLCAGGDRG